MTSRLAIFVALASTVQLISAEQCPASEYSGNMLNYLNLVGDTIKGVTDRIKVEKGKFLKEMNDNFTKAFEKAGCPDFWSAEFQPKPWLHTLMKLNDAGAPKPTTDMIEQLERVIWLFAQDHMLGTCIMSVTRGYILGLISKCTGDEVFPVDEAALKDVTLPNFASDKEFETNARSALNLMAWALMRATACGDGADSILAAVNVVIKATDEDLCYAGSDSFVSDACYEKFQGSCPKIMECMDDLSKDLQKHATQLFVKEGHRFKKCLKRSFDHWKEVGKKPEGVPSAGALMARGLRHWAALSKIEFTEEEKVASTGYFRALAASILRPHSCNCEVPVAPGDSAQE